MSDLKAIDPGDLRSRLTLQSPTPTIVSHEQTTVWGDVATVWGAIEGLTGTEKMIAEKLDEIISLKVTIRYIPAVSVNTRMRFLYTDPQGNNHQYNVVSIVDIDNRHVYLQAYVSEQQAGG